MPSHRPDANEHPAPDQPARAANGRTARRTVPTAPGRQPPANDTRRDVAIRAVTRGEPLPRGSAARPASLPDPHRYTIGDLEASTGLPGRTIRYYISKKLLAPAHGRGPTATYDRDHLLRLQAIVNLQRSGLSLDDIRDRLDDFTADDIAAMLHVEAAPRQAHWRRIELHPDVELHVREPEGRRRDAGMDRAVARIEAVARDEFAQLDR